MSAIRLQNCKTKNENEYIKLYRKIYRKREDHKEKKQGADLMNRHPASCINGGEPKSGLAREPGDCLQSRNVLFGTSGDC